LFGSVNRHTARRWAPDPSRSGWRLGRPARWDRVHHLWGVRPRHR